MTAPAPTMSVTDATPRIQVCHAPPGAENKWNSIKVSVESLDGHANHPDDIWPPVPEITEGLNWESPGIGIWASGCAIPTPPPTPSPSPTATATPSPTPSPTAVPTVPATLSPTPPSTYDALPTTGTPTSTLLLCVTLLALLGLLALSWGHPRR